MVEGHGCVVEDDCGRVTGHWAGDNSAFVGHDLAAVDMPVFERLGLVDSSVFEEYFVVDRLLSDEEGYFVEGTLVGEEEYLTFEDTTVAEEREYFADGVWGFDGHA